MIYVDKFPSFDGTNDGFRDKTMDVSKNDSGISLVQRLRLGGPNAAEVAGEAADEIERLRSLVEKARKQLSVSDDYEFDVNGPTALPSVWKLQNQLVRDALALPPPPKETT